MLTDQTAPRLPRPAMLVQETDGLPPHAEWISVEAGRYLLAWPQVLITPYHRTPLEQGVSFADPARPWLVWNDQTIAAAIRIDRMKWAADEAVRACAAAISGASSKFVDAASKAMLAGAGEDATRAILRRRDVEVQAAKAVRTGYRHSTGGYNWSLA